MGHDFTKLEEGAEKAAVQGTKVKNLAIKNLQKVANKHKFNVNVKKIEKKFMNQLKQAIKTNTKKFKGSKYESMLQKYTNYAKNGWTDEWSKKSPLEILGVLTSEATGVIDSKVSNKDMQKTLLDFLKDASVEAEKFLNKKGVGHEKMGHLGHEAVEETQKKAQMLAKKHKVEKKIKKGVQQLKKSLPKFGTM